jgi:putative membrane protein
MVSGHRKAVAAFKSESNSGKDPEVKAWAAKTLPTIEGHLAEVQGLSKAAVGTTGTKSTAPKPTTTPGTSGNPSTPARPSPTDQPPATRP